MNEQISLLKQAAEEITSLRRQNELMNTRLHMFDSMMRVFNVSPGGGMSCGMGEDIAWKINKYLEEMEKQPTTLDPEPPGMQPFGSKNKD